MKVVIVGGGFAGIKAARILKKKFDVTIIEQNDHFTFKPLLHEYIVGTMPFDSICIPIKEAAGRQVTHIKGFAKSIDADKRTISVSTTDKSATITLPYDYLLVTIGAYPIIEGSNGLAHPYDMQKADMMKEQARTIRDRIRNHERISIGIVGAGPVGIEIAFVMREFMEHYSRMYHNANSHSITLYNSGEDILANYSMRIASIARSHLAMSSIKVENFCLVRRVEKKNGYYNINYQRDGNINSARHDMVFWTAGTKKNSIGTMTFETDRYLRSKNNKHIFAAGDAASIDIKRKNVPMLAQLAVVQGVLAANNIMRASRSRKLKPFIPRIKGLLLTVGHKKEIGIIGKRIVLRGFFAWWLHRMVYVMQLFSFKRKFHNIRAWTKDLYSPRYSYIDSED